MIRSFLEKHGQRRSHSFHMPGHKGKALYKEFGYDDFLEHFLDWDITEIPGADNLFLSEGIIKNTEKRYEKLYDVDKSYLLINGTSGGLIASILATVPEGGKLIMARNCHKSIFNGLTLGRITPVYLYPKEEGGIAGAVSGASVEEALKKNPDAAAVILPSPNYYGICSDIEEIAKITHQAGKILIVDQAHGAHLPLFHKFGYGANIPKGGEECGADIVVNSTHKTLASMTQSAILNVQGDLVNLIALEDGLQKIESTSPSYVLMASLDINLEILENHGPKLFKRWQANMDYFYGKNIEGMELIEGDHLDPTKINISFPKTDISGYQLEQWLMEENIFTELHTGNLLMAMTGIGNKREDYRMLYEGLEKIGKEKINANRRYILENKEIMPPEKGKFFKIPSQIEYVQIEKAIGRVSGGCIIPYPPGIPLICPGEIITREEVEYINNLREKGEKVIGISEGDLVSVAPLFFL